MPTIAPWLMQSNPLEMARSGASLGLQMRGQDIEQAQAGDRLRLAYDQLAAEERQRAREVQTRQELAAATMSLKAQQLRDLMQHRQELEAVAMQRQKDLANYQQGVLREKAIADELRNRGIHFAPGGEVLKVGEDGTVEQLRPPTEKPKKPANVRVPLTADPLGPSMTGAVDDPDIVKALSKYSSSTNSPTGAAPSGFNLLQPSTWFGKGAAPALPSTGTNVSTAPAPYKEGALIRDKQTKQLYRVIGGKPVPVDSDVPGPTPDPNYPNPND